MKPTAIALIKVVELKAIKLAAELEVHKHCFLSINFLPNAVYKPELCIRTTLNAAEEYQFPKEKIIFDSRKTNKLRTANI